VIPLLEWASQRRFLLQKFEKCGQNVRSASTDTHLRVRILQVIEIHGIRSGRIMRDASARSRTIVQRRAIELILQIRNSDNRCLTFTLRDRPLFKRLAVIKAPLSPLRVWRSDFHAIRFVAKHDSRFSLSARTYVILLNDIALKTSCFGTSRATTRSPFTFLHFASVFRCWCLPFT